MSAPFPAVSSFSTTGFPSVRRLSFFTAWRIANHVKNGMRNNMPTIGILSGLVTIRKKSSSNMLTARNKAMPGNRISAALLL